MVDDSITVQKVVGLILAERDFEIKSANNGEEALALIPSFMPDIILSDVEMPGMNGYQLCEKIKKAPATSRSSVILLTGSFEPIDEELARNVRADDFIVAPFESGELISKINAALAVSAAMAEEGGEDLFEDKAVGSAETPDEGDLWSLREISETEEPAGWLAAEEEGAGTEELIEFGEEAETVGAATQEIKLPPSEKVRPEDDAIDLSRVELLARDDIGSIRTDTPKERISTILSSIDIKGTLLAVMTPLLKDSIENALWEVAPDLVDETLNEMLEGPIKSYPEEIEKVVLEILPDLTESMIRHELDRINTKD